MFSIVPMVSEILSEIRPKSEKIVRKYNVRIETVRTFWKLVLLMRTLLLEVLLMRTLLLEVLLMKNYSDDLNSSF